MRLKEINIERDKEFLYNLFESFNKKGDIYEYFGLWDNKETVKLINDIAKSIGFDFNVYKERRRMKPRICEQCGKEYNPTHSKQRFCSQSCVATYTNTGRVVSKESREKRRLIQLKKIENGEVIDPKTGEVKKLSHTKICPFCGKEFITNRKHKKFCSRSCAMRNRYKDSHDREFKYYKRQCMFKFALNSYEKEFDFKLIEENGWYKAKNHGDNLNGVSRDHIFSVKERI